MPFFRHRRRIAWLASLVMLVSALLPALASAMTLGAESPQWAEICTMQGMKRVLLDVDPAKSPDSSASSLTDCPFCTSGAHSPPLPVSPVALIPPDAAHASVPERFLSAARTPHAWRSAQPRAPPALA